MIRQFLSLMAGLLLFYYPLSAMEPCFICNDRLPEFAHEPRVTLNCNHSYHPTCIHTWCQTNPICPNCRQSISPEQIAYFNFVSNAHDEQHKWVEALAQHRKLQILCICGGAAIILYLSKDKILNWLSSRKENVA